MAGYSGTPLAKKLGIKEGSRLFLSGAPKNYLQLVAPLPEAEKIGGPALGLMEDSAYETSGLTLDEGDRLLFFTDGIYEASNPQGEEFGTGRLGEAWRGRSGDSLAAALPGLRMAAADFSGGQPFGDDVCLVACELRS